MATNKGTDQAVTRREHDLDREGKRVTLLDPFGGILTEGNFAKKMAIIESGAVTTIYKGKAQIGTATSADEWQVGRMVIDSSSGTVISETWADGDDEFNNVWDNYLTLTYS